MPLCYGGGIKTVDHAQAIVDGVTKKWFHNLRSAMSAAGKYRNARHIDVKRS